MAGRKFGASGHEDLTWAMNAHVPALVAEAFAGSRIVAYSTGCVYPYVDVHHGGATEATPMTPPPGDYANSCVAREQMFQYFSRTRGTPGRIIRLNYAIDMRYGVLHDVASRVKAGRDDRSRDRARERDLAGRCQRAWCCARSRHCTTPSTPLNVSGPETISVRWLARGVRRAARQDAGVRRQEAPTAWLVNTAQAMRLFGYPRVPLARLIDWTADWIARGLPSLGKPTGYRNARWQVLICLRSGALALAELADAEALVAEAGWNQVAADWRIFLDFGTVYAVRDGAGA